MSLYFIIGVSILLLIIFLLAKKIAPKPFRLTKKHVMITGGSSGIGKGIALEVLKHGANVTLVARDKVKLLATQSELTKHCSSGQRVYILPLDVTSDCDTIDNVIQKHMSQVGEVNVLVNCAGYSRLGEFCEIPTDQFRKLMEVNYLGSVYPTRAVLPAMKALRSGRIVFISSGLGQFGIYGTTAYSASKFALRGLAEALQMEVGVHNIRVTIAFPSDTDTPGYTDENETKPLETDQISQVAGLHDPNTVGKSIVKDIIAGKFLSCMGFEGTMLTLGTCGMAPVTSLLETFIQVVSLGLLRFVSVFYLIHFDNIVKKCQKQKLIKKHAN